MERHKHVYPAVNTKWYVCGCLLIISIMVVVSGFISKERSDGFLLNIEPSASPVPLNEEFDETPATMEFDVPSFQWYALQLGAFENEESALRLAENYQKRGAAGFLWHDGRYRVLAAVYPVREEAQQVREQLRDQHTIDSYLYTIDFPAIKLRVSGMQGQLEILQAAFMHAHDLAMQLQNASVSIDRNEVSAEEVREQITAIDTQIRIVSLRLRQRYINQIPMVVRELLKCFEAYSDFAAQISEVESSVLLGTKLKHQTLSVLWGLQNVYQALYHT